MIPVTPVLIPEPFAEDGTKNVIPAQSPGATEPNASWNTGFPPITMLNRQAGGKPPLGADFNGVLNALSQHAFFTQSGCVFPWQGASEEFPGLNYLVGAHVLGSDMKEYTAVQPSGPDIPASGGGYVGPQDPVEDTDHVYWRPEVTSADIPEFDGVTIREINGKYGVPEFTAPTASAPGKAGLVPGPPMITERSIINQFLSGQGWRAITTALLGLDQITQTPVLVPTTQPVNIADANTMPAGMYNSENWVNTPTPSGLLLTIQGIELGEGGYYALQLFLDYGGKVWLRLAQSNEVPGTFPHWREWGLIGTPRPQSGAGMGQWKEIYNSGSGDSITLPAGGTWAYFLIGYRSGGIAAAHAAGVAAGGTTIQLISGSSTVVGAFGFVWRVA